MVSTHLRADTVGHSGWSVLMGMPMRLGGRSAADWSIWYHAVPDGLLIALGLPSGNGSVLQHHGERDLCRYYCGDAGALGQMIGPTVAARHPGR